MNIEQIIEKLKNTDGMLYSVKEKYLLNITLLLKDLQDYGALRGYYITTKSQSGVDGVFSGRILLHQNDDIHTYTFTMVKSSNGYAEVGIEPSIFTKSELRIIS